MLDRLRARAQRSDEGFTLIELLIVIVILGILAAIVVFAVGTSTTDAKTNACNSDVKTTEVAVEAYRAQSGTGAYPATLSDLVPTWLREAPTDVNYNASTGAVTPNCG